MNPQDLDNATNNPTSITYLLELSRNFERIKTIVNTMGNSLLNSIFQILGYHFTGILQRPNLLHISAMSWILAMLKEIAGQLHQQDQTFNTLLAILQNLQLPSKEFIENIRLFINMYGLNEPAFSDNKIFEIFFLNFNNAKNFNMQNFTNEKKYRMKDFEDILTAILRTGINFAVNEFNSREEHKNSTDMTKCFTDLQMKNEISRERFIEQYAIIKQLDLNDIKNSNLEKQLCDFVDFCSIDAGGLINEISFFNSNATSLLYKVRSMLTSSHVRNLVRKYYSLIKGTARNQIKRISSVKDHGYEILKRRGMDATSWLNSSLSKSEVVKKLKESYTTVQDFTTSTTEIPRRFIYEHVYKPSHNLTIFVTDSTVNIVANTYRLSDKVKKYLQDTVSKTKNQFKDLVSKTEAMININFSEDILKPANSMVSIIINRAFFLIAPQLAMSFMSEIISKLREINIKDTTNKAIDYSKDKYLATKIYLYESYRKFLGNSTEDTDKQQIELAKLSSENKQK